MLCLVGFWDWEGISVFHSNPPPAPSSAAYNFHSGPPFCRVDHLPPCISHWTLLLNRAQIPGEVEALAPKNELWLFTFRFSRSFYFFSMWLSWHPRIAEMIVVILTWRAEVSRHVRIISLGPCSNPVSYTQICRCYNPHFLDEDAERSPEGEWWTPNHSCFNSGARTITQVPVIKFNGNFPLQPHSFLHTSPIVFQIPSWCHPKKIGKPWLLLTFRLAIRA